MGAVKANNNKDTYKATAVAFIVIGTLFLINKLLKIIPIYLNILCFFIIFSGTSPKHIVLAHSFSSFTLTSV